MKPKDFLVPAVVALALTALSGLVSGFPLRFLEPLLTIQTVGAPTPLFPFRILFVSLLVDLAIWFLVALVLWLLFKFWSRMVLIPLIVLVVVFGISIFWQYNLYQKLSQTDMGCGGDWTYMVKCPFGSYCRSLGQGPLAGGACRPWLSSVFEIFGFRGEQAQIPVPTPEPTPAPIPESEAPLTTRPPTDWMVYSNTHVSFEYPSSWVKKNPQPIGSGLVQEIQSPDRTYTLTFTSRANYNNATGEPFSSLGEFVGDYPEGKTEKTTLDQREAIRILPYTSPAYIGTDKESDHSAVYVFSKDQQTIYILEITIQAKQDMAKVRVGHRTFNQVLSTFKFLD